MTRSKARLTTIVPVACLVLSAWSAAHAQTYPDRPIRLVVANTPGGTADTSARVLAKEMAILFGQPLVIDNRGGANGIIGADVVAKATPDGYTLLHISSSLAINASVYKKLPYDVSRDFTPITNVILGQGALVTVHSSVPAQSISELIALAKERQLAYSTPGTGNILHLVTEAFSLRAGIHMLHVPYKGAGPGLTALLAAEVQVMVVPPLIATPYVKAGRLRALAYSGAKRLNAMPELPTISEAGLPGFHMATGWHGWFAPAKTTDAIVTRVYSGLRDALKVPRVREYFVVAGYEPVADPPAQFQKSFQAELKSWADIVRLAKISPE